ncbi:MAG: DUF1223 domain-containing protein [Acidobacteriota bacterium]|nr:DUF1223 domain-containing protein [Acidobacteriota bacterium]
MKSLVAMLIAVVALFSSLVAVDRQTSATTSPASKAEGKPMPVIVELFTSEGCSSCPPADAVLIELEKTQPVPGAEVIALGEHVDYWNRLGWTDPYSDAGFSARQSEYAQAFGRDGVYTPQMIVDGQAEFIGSNMNKAREAISKAARAPKAAVQVSLAPNPAGKKTDAIALLVRVENVPALSAGDTAQIMLAITENDLRSQVSRGENAGRSLRHIAVVRQIEVIGSPATEGGSAFTAEPIVTIANGWKRDNLRAVIFVQERRRRRVLGAQAIGLAGK